MTGRLFVVAPLVWILAACASSTPPPSPSAAAASPSAIATVPASTAVSPAGGATGAGIEAIPLFLDFQAGKFTEKTNGAYAPVRALLWRPVTPSARKPVGIVLMHEDADFTHHPACSDLASRGFEVVCANGRYVNAKGSIIFDDLPLDLKPAVQYLRQRPDIKKVFLLGHSGGGALMSYYQNVAENGVSVCQDTRRIVPCSSALAGLPKADGVILLDPIPGLAFSQLTYWDPSVTAEDQFGRIDGSKVDPSLEMFSAANGYDAKSPHYSADFVKRFYSAQGARNERLIALARSRLAALGAHKGWFPEDEPFIVNRQAARLWVTDLGLFAHTAQPETLVTASGEKKEIVSSVRPLGTSVVGDISKANFSYKNALVTTVRSFLSTYAIHSGPEYQATADAVTGVDWQSSNTSLIANLGGVRSPLLMVSMTAHYWLVTTEMGYSASPSTDKTLAYIEGATHGFTPCKACEKTPGQFGDTEKTLMDYVARWLDSHT